MKTRGPGAPPRGAHLGGVWHASCMKVFNFFIRSAMHDLPTDWTALCALVFLLGMRHGFDADHLATIDGLTRLTRRRGGAFARWCGLRHPREHHLRSCSKVRDRGRCRRRDGGRSGISVVIRPLPSRY